MELLKNCYGSLDTSIKTDVTLFMNGSYYGTLKATQMEPKFRQNRLTAKF